MWVCPCEHTRAKRVQKRASDPPELELQLQLGNGDMGAGNWTGWGWGCPLQGQHKVLTAGPSVRSHHQLLLNDLLPLSCEHTFQILRLKSLNSCGGNAFSLLFIARSVSNTQSLRTARLVQKPQRSFALSGALKRKRDLVWKNCSNAGCHPARHRECGKRLVHSS